MRRAIVVAVVGLILACSAESVTSPTSLREFFSLDLSPKAINVATGATQQLTVTPKDVAGNPLSGLPVPTFLSTDTSVAQVSASGVVTGRKTGSSVITASIQSDSLTLSDRVTVTVTATQRTLASFTIAPKTVTLGAGATQRLTPTSRDQSGAVISGLGRPFYVSTDTTKARVSAFGTVTAVSPGQAKIAATITSGGVTKTDTALIAVTNPRSATVTMNTSGSCCLRLAPGESAILPPIVVIAPSGTVRWDNRTATSPDSTSFAVTFGNAAAVTGGDIAAFKSGSVTRTFPTAGTYTYTVTAFVFARNRTNTLTGTVIVQ
jgi:Big-like domain-containing protein